MKTTTPKDRLLLRLTLGAAAALGKGGVHLLATWRRRVTQAAGDPEKLASLARELADMESMSSFAFELHRDAIADLLHLHAEAVHPAASGQSSLSE